MNAQVTPAPMRPLFLLAVLALAALSGCFGDPGPSSKTTSSTTTTTSSSSSTQPPIVDPCPSGPCASPPGHFAFNDCQDFIINFNAMQSTVQNHLPQGYTATDSSGGTTIVSTRVLDCGSVVLDNRTVLGATRLVAVSVPITAPEPVATGRDLYVLEMLSSDPTLSARLSEQGFPTVQAAVAVMRDGLQFNLDAAGPDGLHYAFKLAGQEPQPDTPFPRGWRVHHQTGGRNNWYNETLDEFIASTPLTGTLEHSGGILSSLVLLPAGPMHVVSTLYQGSNQLDFDS